MNVQAAIDESVLFRLNAGSAVNLVNWTEVQLFEFADECARRLARQTGCFTEYDDTGVAVAAATSQVTLPARHVSTVAAFTVDSSDTVPVALKPAIIKELESLDPAWTSTEGNFLKRFAHSLGMEAVTVYPKLYAGRSATLKLVMRRAPATIASGTATVATPVPLQDYFALSMVAAARSHEGEAQMTEVADSLGQFLGVIEDAMRSYWGEAI